MDDLLFLQTVLPTTGVYVLGFRQDSPNPEANRKYTIWNSAHKDIYSLNKAAMEKSASTDVFFCYGSSKGWGTKEGRNGRYKSIRFKENMVAFRSFVLDIDVEAENPDKHSTRKEALVDFYQFCSEHKFPLPSLLVMSGNGLHLYWVLNNDINTAEWSAHTQGIARKFESNKERKCFVDLTRVADPAGLLRPVGTLNHKGGELVRVVQDTGKRYDLSAFAPYRLEGTEYKPAIISNKDKERMFSHPLSKQFYSIVYNQYAPVAVSDVVSSCAQLKYVKDNVGAVGYNMWYSTMGVLAFTKNPEESIKDVMGVNEGKFNLNENLEKYNEVINNQSGPTTCAHLRNRSDVPTLCDGCPNATKGTNPCSISHNITKKQERKATALAKPKSIILHDGIGKMEFKRNWSDNDITIPYTLPHPFFEKDGFLHHMKKTVVVNGDGKKEYVDEPEVFYPGIVYPIGLSEIEDNSDTLNKRSNVIEIQVREPKTDGRSLTRKVRIGAEFFSSPIKLKGELFKNKIFPYDGPSCEDALVSYLKRCTTFINTNQIPIQHKTKLGWQFNEETGKVLEFVAPYTTVRADGSKVQTIAEKTLLTLKDDAFPKPRGELSEWVEAYSCYAPYDSEGKYGYIMSQVWGSILMPFLKLEAIRGFLISLIGPSGTGKSTITALMMSSIGKPSPTIFTNEDTFVSKMTKLQTFNNVMMPFDELTNMSAEQVSKLAYAMAQGEGKSRSNKDGELQGGKKTWAGVGVCSSNFSLKSKLDSHERNDTSAERYRMFEIPWEGDPNVNRDHIDAATRIISDNHGLAIPKYCEYIINNIDRVQKEVVEYYDNIRKERGRSEERFYDANITVTCLGHKYAKEAGLMEGYDGDLISTFGQRLRNLSSTQISSGKCTSEDIILDYYRKSLDKVVHASKYIAEGAASKKIHVKPIGDLTKELTMRLENDVAFKGSSYLYVAVSPFKKYCNLNGLDYNRIFSDIYQRDIVICKHSKDPKGKRKDLLYGTNRADDQLRINCLCLNFKLLNQGQV